MSSLEDYKTVLIIGNGFDLSLKYPTSYSDFMKSQYFVDLVLKKNTLAKYLQYKKGAKNWIDIEKELATYSNLLVREQIPMPVREEKNFSTIIESFRTEFGQLCIALKEYLKDLENLRFNEGFEHSPAYNLIKRISYERELCYIVNFNYTVFADKIINCFENCRDFQIRQIHGSLNKNIVFGVQDSIELKPEHLFLYKSYSRYQDVRGLPQILKNADKIIFFGYSLGETDHSYFDDFFKNQTKENCRSKSFVFYHYGQAAYDDLIWQLKLLTHNRTSYLNQYNNIQFEDSSIMLK
jgi:hypothetical protein